MAWAANFDDFTIPPVDQFGTHAPMARKRQAETHQMQNTTDTTLSGSVKIAELTSGMTVSHIVGVIIAKGEQRHFPSKKDPSNERYVLSFTLRDSAEDFINVTCWGGEQFISDIVALSHVGIVVELSNVMVQAKPEDGTDEKFNPNTPSMYQLNLGEARGSVKQFGGWNISQYATLLNIPVKPHNDFYTISDILANSSSLQSQFVSIMAAVKQVGSVKEITTKMGRQTKRCEVSLFDETAMDFTLILWDAENIRQAQEWIPKSTVLFLADVRVTYNEYKKTMVATASSKSVITPNPNTREARQLFQYAENCDLPTEAYITNDGSSGIDLASVKTVCTVSDLKYMCNNLSTPESQICIVYACISSLAVDTDDTNSIMTTRCVKCRRRISNEFGECDNQDCPIGCMAGHGGVTQETVVQLNLSVTLSDHTGSQNACILAGEPASSMLGCTPAELMDMDDSAKTSLKWKFLLERCKLYVKVLPPTRDNATGRVKILKSTLCTAQDLLHSIQ